MMFMCHYVIIPFHPQYLPRHAPQGAGCQGAGCRWLKTLKFPLLITQNFINKRHKEHQPKLKQVRQKITTSKSQNLKNYRTKKKNSGGNRIEHIIF